MVVGVAITVLVYGAVALDREDGRYRPASGQATDAARGGSGAALVNAMPKLLAVLSAVGTVAMLWVGGGIVLHGAASELGLHWPCRPRPRPAARGRAARPGRSAGVLGWLTTRRLSAVVGLVLGAVVAVIIHQALKLRGAGAH